MTIEQKERVRIGHLGQSAWNRGRKMDKKFKDKIRELTLRGVCGMLGRRHSKETKEKMRLHNKTSLLWKREWYKEMMSESHKGKMTGESNPAYIDGRNGWKGAIRRSPEMRGWIGRVFKRDNFTCQDCDKVGGRLEAHHKVSFSKILSLEKIYSLEDARKSKLLWDISNGMTLCKDCHRKYPTRE